MYVCMHVRMYVFAKIHVYAHLTCTFAELSSSNVTNTTILVFTINTIDVRHTCLDPDGIALIWLMRGYRLL